MEGTRPGEFNPQNIPHEIAALQPDIFQVPVLNEKYFDGGQCRIYKVDFPHKESWAVRIPLHIRNAPRRAIINLLQGEIIILQELEAKGFRWAPRLRGSSLTFENSVGYPFIALSWLSGDSLSWSLEQPARPIRDQILGQIASIIMSLVESTCVERTEPATKYFERIIDNKVYRVHSGLLPEINVQDCIIQKQLLSTILRPELENAPYAIEHGDLSCRNIIVDSEYNITGFVDWGFAAKRPLQMACSLPRFLCLEQPVLLPPPLILQEDRKIFISSLLLSGPSVLAKPISINLSSEDIDFQQCFLESIVSKGMHRWLAEQGWKLPKRI